MNITLRKKATNSVVADYLFDKGSGSILYDQSGNGNNGELKNSPSWVDGKFGGALDFDGDDQYVDLGSPDTLDRLTKWTYAAWIKPDRSGDSYQMIIVQVSKWSNGFWYTPAGNTLRAYRSTTATAATSSSSTTLDIDSWNLVIVTYDDTGDRKFRFYINRIEVSYAVQQAATGTLTDLSASSLNIGGDEDIDSFKGKIDKTSIFNKILSQTEIDALYIQNKVEHIVADSLVKEDIINEQKDTLRFQIQKYGDEGFVPAINDEYELYIDSVKEFAGVILEVNKSIQASQMVVYDVVCVDYSVYANRELVLERFDNRTVNYIINDIVPAGFTVTNVDCDVEIKTVVFNRMTLTECLDKLAKLVGYSWYIDYDKDIHFFERSVNTAPFEITDTNGKYLQNTLSVRDDLSQLRNTIVVRGADEEGTVRTESYVADGEQVMFPLSNKFAEMPSIYIQDESSSSTIGVDFLHDEDDYDCFWNFNEKYIRFKDGTKPAADKKIEITGIPLFPIIIKRFDPVSVATYGVYEFFQENKDIKSRAEALEFAQAQLESYKDGIIEGSFQTDESGLRSGQLITIDSDLLNIDETFLIQRVQFRVLAKNKGMWSVTLATLRTVGIIQILQDLIRASKVREFDPENLLTLIQFKDEMSGVDVLGSFATSKIPYFWVGAAEQGLENPGKYNFSTYDDTDY